MKENKTGLLLPETAQDPDALVDSYYGDLDQQAMQEHLASMTPEQVIEAMPDVHTVETPNGNRIQYAELLGTGEDDPENAYVMFLPYGNGWAPHMFIRALQAQAALGDDTRMLIFPNATPGNKPYSLSKEEQRAVAEGKLDIVAEKLLRATEALGVISVGDLVGYSQGASVGGAAVRRAAENGTLQINNGHLGEPANAMNRTPHQLQSAFQKTGLGPLIRDVNNSGIPALSEIQHTRGGLDTLRLIGGLATVVRGSRIPENKALHKAMAHNTFFDDVSEALLLNPTLKIDLMNAENSTIYPKEVADEGAIKLAEKFPGRVSAIEVADSNHAAGDNTTNGGAILGLAKNKMKQ